MTSMLTDTSLTSLTSDGWHDAPIFAGFYVYALYGAADELLYIGQSTGVMARISGHVNDPDKRDHIVRVAVHECESRADMDETEKRLILAHRPPWNIAGLPTELVTERLRVKHAARRAAEKTAGEVRQKVMREDPRARYSAGYLLSTSHTAALLGCSEVRVQTLIATGALAYIDRLGSGHRRFRPDDLAELVATHPELVPDADLPEQSSVRSA